MDSIRNSCDAFMIQARFNVRMAATLVQITQGKQIPQSQEEAAKSGLFKHPIDMDLGTRAITTSVEILPLLVLVGFGVTPQILKFVTNFVLFQFVQCQVIKPFLIIFR